MATLMPIHPVAKPRQEVVNRIKELENINSFVLSPAQSVICLQRAAADLTRDGSYENTYAPEHERRDFDVEQATVNEARSIATNLVQTDNIIIVSSINTRSMAELWRMDDDDDIDSEAIHLLHYLTYECGWILTVLGDEDCIDLGVNIYCLVKDPGSETMHPLLDQFNQLYFTSIGEYVIEEVAFGTRYQIEVLNPLDKMSWRDPKSTPHEQGYDEDEDVMIINDDEQQEWSATFPLDTTDDEENGELLRRLYAKLDSVTEYKNSLAAEIVRLNGIINSLQTM
ncbi:MAG: hypothetical protein CBC48_00460 [bacterium TMED88]|nr:MAG: hypothetical protein CBC48_00460 [bacterium TMED88]